MEENVNFVPMGKYQLDRTAFKAQSAEEAGSYKSYYASLTWQERLEIAGYLNSMAFNFPPGHPPKLDRTAFKVRTRDQ